MSLQPLRNNDATLQHVMRLVQNFYFSNPQIQPSHGWPHIQAVYQHTCHAIACHRPAVSFSTALEIQMAALLHDLDDRKYFPQHKNHENARRLLENAANVSLESINLILYMISLVSCSENGNSVPSDLNERYHLLIPRWADRLEAVGKVGVVRCYQYNQEQQHPLHSSNSPRPSSLEELWECVTPNRFQVYQQTGKSDDMISHYYDKLLHISCPPKELVRNQYLEYMAEESSRELVEVCLRYGKTGKVDEDYIQELAQALEQQEI